MNSQIRQKNGQNKMKYHSDKIMAIEMDLILLVKCTYMKKIDLGKIEVKTNKIKTMSLRCKVCNTSGGINSNQISCNGEWECQTCGNILDVDGNISSS